MARRIFAILLILIAFVFPSCTLFRIHRFKSIIVSRKMSVIGDCRRTCGKFELFSLQTSFDEDNSSEENIFRDLVKLLMDSFLAVMSPLDYSKITEKVAPIKASFAKGHGNIHQLRKLHGKDNAWDRDDIIKEFEAKYILKDSAITKDGSTTAASGIVPEYTSKEDTETDLLRMIHHLEKLELLEPVNDHINFNRDQINRDRGNILVKAALLVDSELNKKDLIDKAIIPTSHSDKAAEFEYSMLEGMKPLESEEENIALKLKKLKMLLESKQHRTQ